MGSHMMVPIYFVWVICAVAFIMMGGAPASPHASAAGSCLVDLTHPNPSLTSRCSGPCTLSQVCKFASFVYCRLLALPHACVTCRCCICFEVRRKPKRQRFATVDIIQSCGRHAVFIATTVVFRLFAPAYQALPTSSLDPDDKPELGFANRLSRDDSANESRNQVLPPACDTMAGLLTAVA